MKLIIKLYSLLLALSMAVGFTACNIDEIADPNNPSVDAITQNASRDEIQNLVDGIQSGMRSSMNFYYEGVSVIGRELYRFSGSDPRYLSDLLGQAELDNNTFYTTNPFAARYRVVRQTYLLEDALAGSGAVTADEAKAARGYAKTIRALQLLMVLNQQGKNGIRVDVKDPDKLGPFLTSSSSATNAPALSAIKAILDEGYTDLSAGGSFPFALNSGFAGFDTPATFAKFNRALAARVALYNGQWSDAIAALENSFLDPAGNFNTGPSYLYSAAGGDLLNQLWYPAGASGEVLVVHPSFTADAEAGDARLSKVAAREPIASGGVSSSYDFRLFGSNVSPIPIIRNEELILIWAEAKAQLGDTAAAIDAINIVRSTHGLADYNGTDIINQILKERRYSLFGEGHRWIDMRRYDRLGELPIDRDTDRVWSEFPRPANEEG